MLHAVKQAYRDVLHNALTPAFVLFLDLPPEVLQTSTDHATRKKAFARMLEIAEREDPAYTVLHQNAVFTGMDTLLNRLAVDGYRMAVATSKDQNAARRILGHFDLLAPFEFVGGADIVTEMTLSGELDQLFDKSGVTYDKEAAERIRQANG